MRVGQVADIHEVVEVEAVAHLEARAALQRDGDHLAQRRGVVLAEREAGAQRAGEEASVPVLAVRGDDGLLRVRLGQGVDAVWKMVTGRASSMTRITSAAEARSARW